HGAILALRATQARGGGERTTMPTPTAVNAIPVIVNTVMTSPNSSHAIKAVQGGTRNIRLVTAVAAPRWISRYSSELPPKVSASTDQAMAPVSWPFQRTLSGS